MNNILTKLLFVIIFQFCLMSCCLDINEDTTGFDTVANNTLSFPTEESEISDEKIVMPNSTSYYIGAEYTIDSLTEHFFQLGFTNIITIPCEPDNDTYKNNIFEMTIKTGWFSDDPWEAGEKFNSDAEITIYYNESPLLTVKNCPDLVTVLTSKDMEYMTFANKYNGKYFEFEAYVTNSTAGDGYVSDFINITGGNYDGVSEVGHYDEEYYKGLIIRVGDRAFGNKIDKNVKEGENVLVSGKIDASWSEFFKMLYIECLYLGKR